MRIVLLYPPPWKIPAIGDEPDFAEDGPPKNWAHGKSFSGDEVTTPYGLLSLAAQAKRAGHSVAVFNVYTYSWSNVARLIRHLPADLYGLSCFTCNRRGTVYVSQLIRELHPQAYIVAGGPHASALHREMLEHCEAIDGIVIGEGEATFMDLIERLDNGESTDGIAGMAGRTEKGVELGPPRGRIKDLDSLASPYDFYKGFIVISTRGCPGNCSFCGSPAVWGRKVRFHSAEYTLDMIEKIIKSHDQKILNVKDDTFTFGRKRVLKICDGIIKKGMNFQWSCDTRADALDEEVLFSMRRAGCKLISIGVESASPEILKRINKNITPEQVIDVTRMAKKFGFQIRYYMMAGNRGESGESLQASIDFIHEARPNQFLFYFYTLYPGTEEFEIAVRSGLASREMFFSEDDHEFQYFLGKEDSPLLRENIRWVQTHSNVSGFWDYSVSQRQAILETLSDLPDVYLELGGAYFKEGNFAEAERLIRHSIDMGHSLPGLGFNYLACISAGRGDANALMDNLKKAKQQGHHYVVETNLNALQQWANSDRVQGASLPELIANHDFEVAHLIEQPVKPGPITEAHQVPK